jgi:hypothetical protein
MAVSKRARSKLEWYVISKRTLYLIAASVLAAAGMVWGGWWLYQYLQNNIGNQVTVGRRSARFSQIEGKVKVKRANSTEFSTAREEMELEAGDTIQTQADSVARVQFVDGSSYTIKPDTTLVIKDNSLLADKNTSVHVAVDTGTINLATGEQSAGSSNVVQTTAASARVGGNTEASVAAGEKTEIRVTRGSANIRTRSGETYEAAANERFEIENSGKLARREMMLPVPALRVPDNQRYLRLERGQANAVQFQWGAVAQARGYRIELATSAYFGGTVVASRDRLTAPAVTFENLPPGAYYWRVRAYDEKEVPGQYSEPFKFTLIGGASSRALNITVVKQTPLGGNVFVIEGYTEPGARVKVGNVTARVESNGAFRAVVTLGGARELLIEAEDQDGNRGQKRLRL